MAWSEDQPMVSIKDLHKFFGDLEVLKGVSLDVMKGEVICIIGPSGSGKSTLIRCTAQSRWPDGTPTKLSGSAPCSDRARRRATFGGWLN